MAECREVDAGLWARADVGPYAAEGHWVPVLTKNGNDLNFLDLYSSLLSSTKDVAQENLII
jgi:hypothetical protein